PVALRQFRLLLLRPRRRRRGGPRRRRRAQHRRRQRHSQHHRHALLASHGGLTPPRSPPSPRFPTSANRTARITSKSLLSPAASRWSWSSISTASFLMRVPSSVTISVLRPPSQTRTSKGFSAGAPGSLPISSAMLLPTGQGSRRASSTTVSSPSLLSIP